MKKIGIIGGGGYTAGELIRLVLQHPHLELQSVQSKSQAGKYLFETHRDLLGETELRFSPEVRYQGLDIVILALGHGDARVFMENNPIPEDIQVIDLSRDFRLRPEAGAFVYGLPELNREAIRESSRVANPGCFATTIQLGLLPLADRKLLHEEVHIQAITGSTGAGQGLRETSHFSWRNNNVSAYKVFTHQHEGEIYQSLRQLAPHMSASLRFVPIRGNFTRGIFASMYTTCPLGLEEVKSLYRSFYQDSPFTFLSDSNPDLKQVVNTNKALLYLEKHGDLLYIISMIDNLLKGASGQAIQNLNLMQGWNETSGLKLKATYF